MQMSVISISINKGTDRINKQITFLQIIGFQNTKILNLYTTAIKISLKVYGTYA